MLDEHACEEHEEDSCGNDKKLLKNDDEFVRNRLSQKGMQPLQQREEEYCGLLPLSHMISFGLLPLSHMTVLEGTEVNKRARSLQWIRVRSVHQTFHGSRSYLEY